MFKKRNAHIIPIFFLAAFALLRILNVHTFVHVFEDQQEVVDCKYCHMVVASDQGTPLTTTPEALTHNYIHFEALQAVEVNNVYNEPTLKLLKFSYLFNKPPPVVS
ncbi:hypothetical protein ACFSYG_09340 [Leeuwenhoekiella polynyae]|uniref:Uncharacterized protein n=1 Tax=Leeuwenhoekiella polynyae TaxID=1550906 RepID=A0A4Q0PIG7_9FLAO|nr:hypothetical protein [Leeuwenhoekiella polynyae]RXG26081.1 hypothetical protein DSM02_72 [Leeuwenhoekiella polynyae]|tara:strand:+ start:197 stop:514 length:318 start_codon:yes stop_codon:yes gene_type:complete